MRTFFKNITREGSFSKNVFITVSWNGAVIVVQVLLSPIITRLYEPSQYGVFTIFSSLVANLALVGSLKYTDAIVLTETRTERHNLLRLIFSLLLFLSLGSLVALFFFRDSLAEFLKLSGSSTILLFIPFSVFLTCAIEVFANVNIRRKRFSKNGLAIFSNNFFARLTSIGYAVGVAGKSAGLILGDFVGKLVCAAVLLLNIKKGEQELAEPTTPSLEGIKSVARKFRSFPIYYFPSFLLGSFSGHLPLYFFQWQYGSAMVGAYAFASSLMEMFNRLIPYSLAPVLLQKANDLKNISKELLADRVFKLFWVMLLLATLIFSGFALLGKYFFSFVFGSKWLMAGLFSALIAIPSTFNFVAVSLSEVYNVMGRQRLLLLNSVVGLILKVLAIGGALYWHSDEQGALLIYSLLSSVGGIFLILGVFIILNHKVWEALGLLLVSLGVLLGSLWIGHYL